MSTRCLLRCDECQTPIAELREQGLLIKTKHHSVTHVTIVPWERLLRFWQESAAAGELDESLPSSYHPRINPSSSGH